MSKHDAETYVAKDSDLDAKVSQLDAYIRDCIEDRKRQNSYDAQIALQCVRRKMAKLGMIEI